MAQVVLAALGFCLAPSARAQTNDLSLASQFPPDALHSLLLPASQWHPFSRASERTFWENLPAPARQELLRLGEAALAEPLPALPATLYLEFARHGDRGRYEGPYFDRRRRLHQLVLAECVEGQGRFLDAVADTLWALCEESSWCLPAHIGAQRAGNGLPQVTEPIVDLFAAQTGSSVAWTLYLLGPELRGVSPRIPERGRLEVDRRILTSYLERDYGWMGFAARTRDDRPNNWNPWINGNVVTAALLLEPDPDRRVALVHRVLRSLDCFLQPYPPDGGCDEGPGYWTRAGASVLDNLDILSSASAGRLSIFDHPLIGEMGRFIYRVHIADDWFVAIGDCPAKVHPERDVLYRFGSAIHDPHLLAFATGGATWKDVLGSAGGTDLGRALFAVSHASDILARADAKAPFVRDAWLPSDDLQMMVARDQAGTPRGLYVAAWGGHNAQSHNHNDVGNVIVFADGHPVFIDLGAPTYTAKTFSGRRYEIPAMQSDWHNLPTINGTAQAAGRRFAAQRVVHAATDASASISMDIAAAWPGRARVRSWVRTVRLNRGRDLEITEAFDLEALAPGAVLHWLTPCQPVVDADGRLSLPLSFQTQEPGPRVLLEFPPDKLQAAVVAVPVEDARLARVWGDHLNRIDLTAVRPMAQDTWTLRLRLAR